MRPGEPSPRKVELQEPSAEAKRDLPPLIIVPVQVKKAHPAFLCDRVRFLAVVWFVPIAMERPPVVGRDSQPELCLPPFSDEADKWEAQKVPTCVYISSPGFLANFWQRAF